MKVGLAQSAPADFLNAWGAWFFADRRTRRISPWSDLSAEAWIARALEADIPETLREAAQLRPENPQVLARLTHVTLNQSAQENPHRVEEADWLSRRALALAPQDPLAVTARADWLNRQGQRAEGISLMEALPEAARRHSHYWQCLGLLLQFDGRNEDALTAFNRAV